MREHPFTEETINAFFKGNLDARQHREVLDWLSAIPAEKQAEFLDMHWSAMDRTETGRKASGFEQVEKRILDKEQSKHKFKLWGLRAAAALMPLIIISLLWKPAPNAAKPQVLAKTAEAVKTIHTVNTLQENRHIKLPDSSTVTLYPGAELDYAANFSGKTRAVALSGKAFFNVKHFTSKPFTVKTGAITTVVLGTSFWVDAPDEGTTISVKVKTGKVGVIHGTRPALFLLPAEKAVFDLTKGVLAKVKPEKRTILKDVPPATLAFNETPLKQVVNALAENFKLSIVTDGAVNGDLPVNLNTKGKTITEILERIKSQIPIDYEIKGNHIYIKEKP